MPRKPLWSEPVYDKNTEDEKIEKSTTNVRVNLSVPSALYDLIKEYADDNCFPSVPSAVIQMSRMYLRQYQQQKKAIEILSSSTPKEIKKMSPEVIEKLQEWLDPEKPNQ